VLTHAHLDHIAGLPLFIDDLFDSLTEPVEICATGEVIEVLETDIFNWRVYPKFSELENDSGPVMKYREIEPGVPFAVRDLMFEAISVNHKVPAVGYVVSGGGSVVAITGDTSEMSGFWTRINSLKKLDALLIECAFPDRMSGLAEISHHLTPEKLGEELLKLGSKDLPVFAINLKPMYRSETEEEINSLEIPGLSVLEVGLEYDF
jgi:cAMP phosphodiesterase